MASDIAAGMAHLHSRSPPLLHRDLRSPNILVDSSWRAKIADLGLSKIAEEAMAASSTLVQVNPRWAAPEIVAKGNPPTFASDVYSFGVVLWELLTWDLPWGSSANAMDVSAWSKVFFYLI